MAMLGGVKVLGALSNGFVSSWGKVYAGSLRSAIVGLNGVDRPGGEELLVVAVPALLLSGFFAARLGVDGRFFGAVVFGGALVGRGGRLSSVAAAESVC